VKAPNAPTRLRVRLLREGKGEHVMDLHRIPDDLSIPEFLKRGRRRILSDYERDDRESQKQIAGFRSAAEQLRKKGETK
jgi:hypothetical protein